MNQYNPNPFPVKSLPRRVRNSVLEMQHNTGFPIELIVSSALGTMSAACQNSINVQPPVGSISPVSLIVLSIADRGEGKSPTDKYYQEPVRAFEEEEDQKYELAITQLKGRKETWSIELKAIKAAIKKNREKAVLSDDPEQTEEFENLEQKLHDHLSKEPKLPLKYKLIQSNTTPAKIAVNLSENIPTTYLSSDEAGSLLKGEAMKDLGMFNQLWDGSPLNVERKSSPSFKVKDARLTLFLAVQGEVFWDYLAKRGKGARDIGFLARCLVSFPASTKGSRMLSNQAQPWDYLKIFQDRTRAILTQDKLEMDNGRQTRRVLTFSDDAKDLWIGFRNSIEHDLNPGRYLDDISDFGSKISNNLARMAALFHFFEGNEGDEISSETINTATVICSWYVNEFKRLFTKTPEIPVVVSDATELAQSLRNWFQNHPGERMRQSQIAQYGPAKLRSDSARREAAINELRRHNVIQIWNDGKIWWVNLLSTYNMQPNHHLSIYNECAMLPTRS